MIKYAVIAVSRSDGQALTIEIRDDAALAQKERGKLELLMPENRYTVVPYEEQKSKGSHTRKKAKP